MSQRIVNVESLRSVSKVCNSRNYTYNYSLSIALLRKLSTAAVRFDSEVRNPSNCDSENGLDTHQQNSGCYISRRRSNNNVAEFQSNRSDQFKGFVQNQEFNQTPGGQYVQNQRNEVWNGPTGDGSFSGGSRQEKSRSGFQNDGKVLGRFDREGRVNEFSGNGSGGGNIGEVPRQPGGFSKESISNPQSSFGRGFGAGAVQQKQNQFYGVGSSVVNGTYGQSAVHFQQSSGNYSVGNMRNVGTAQMGSSDVRKGSSDSFHGNNFYGDVGSHQQNPYGYHGNKVENYNGYTVGNAQDYQQNPNAMGSATHGGLVEANECYQPKHTVEEIDGLCQEGKLKEAIELLVLLEQQGLSVDMARYFMLMKACGEAKAVEEAKHVHDLFIRRKFPAEISSYNKILEMYCVCGSMDDAYDVFTNMPNRNLTSWDTMILWLAKNGRGEEAIDMFTQFKELGLQPDGEIFFSVFSACSFLGDITEGLLHFESMSKQYGIVPSMQHYIAVVDMLGSTGYLDEALEFIENMPVEPNIDVWETLMNSCRVNGYTELGDRCAELVELLDPSRLSEQSKAGLIPVKASDVAKEKEKKKLTSQNLLEVRSRVHEYRAGDTSHPDNDKIYALLRGLRQQMKEAGYVAETKFVLHDIDQEGKEDALLAHSERLAVAQGLLSSPARQQIRVIKNLRVCGDCHNAMKIISKLVGREFVMRDAKRFHHFKDGVCSCRDYW